MEQSEQLVERAYVRPYTPYVHPRPQVIKIVIIMIFNAMLNFTPYNPYVHPRLQVVNNFMKIIMNLELKLIIIFMILQKLGLYF